MMLIRPTRRPHFECKNVAETLLTTRASIAPLWVDGGYHGRLRERSDQRRDRWLQRQGYTVLRLSDALVLNNRRGRSAHRGAGRCATALGPRQRGYFRVRA